VEKQKRLALTTRSCAIAIIFFMAMNPGKKNLGGNTAPSAITEGAEVYCRTISLPAT
jgi:hypothetical protein